MVGKSLSPILYLISLALIATWIVGVFFGVGFFFLMHHSERPVSHLAFGNTDFSVSLDESPWLLQTMIRLDQLFPEPSQLVGNQPQTGFSDRDRTGAAPGKQARSKWADRRRRRPSPD